jgi:hypothetical protein
MADECPSTLAEAHALLRVHRELCVPNAVAGLKGRWSQVDRAINANVSGTVTRCHRANPTILGLQIASLVKIQTLSVR